MLEDRGMYREMVRGAAGPAIFMVLPDGRIGSWNRGVERLLGYLEPEFVGQPLSLVFTPEDRLQGLPEQALRQAAEADTISGSRWHLRKDGSRFWAHETLSALWSEAGELLGFLKVILDRSEDARTNEAARESEERFQLAFHASPAPTFIIPGADRRFQDVNESFLQLTGYTREELIGRTPDELELVVDKPARDLFLQRLRESGDVPQVEFQLRTKSGQIRDCLMAGRAITLDGKRCSLCSLVDISDRKRTEQDVRRALESVLHDTTWLTHRVMDKLTQIRQGKAREGDLSDLTVREREVVQLIAEGRSNRDIAAELGLSEQTVRNYMTRVYEKIGAASRAEAIVWARERGLGRT